MKNKYRRNVTALFCAVIVSLTAFVAESVRGQGYLRISAGYYPLFGDQQHVDDFVYAMTNNLVSWGTWTALNWSSINITNLFSDPNHGNGIALAFGFYYTNATPFTLRSIGYLMNSPFGTQSNSVVQGGTYTSRGIGVAPDGTVYTSGNADALVNMVALIGFGIFFDTGTNSVDSGLQRFAPYAPGFGVTGSIYPNGIPSQMTSVYVSVPEPATVTLFITGISAVLWNNRRRKF